MLVFQKEKLQNYVKKIGKMKNGILQFPQTLKKKKRGRKALVRITGVLSALIMMVSTAGHAEAKTLDEFIEDSDSIFYVDPNGDVRTSEELSDGANVWEVLEDVLNTSLRVCSKYEVRYVRPVADNEYVFSRENMMKVIDRANYVEDWCKENLPNIINDGLTRDEAIERAYDYLIDNFNYDSEAVAQKDKKTLYEEQGGYHMLTTGYGVCTSYAKLFRAFLEAVPFNDVGLVDWDLPEEEANRISVVLVSSGDHEWAAIEDPETGQLRHYDVTFGRVKRDVYYDKSFEEISSDKSHGTTKKLIYYN